MLNSLWTGDSAIFFWNACVDETLELVGKDHKVTEVPAGKYSEMTVYGIMKFHVKQYDIENLGNLSVMQVIKQSIFADNDAS